MSWLPRAWRWLRELNNGTERLELTADEEVWWEAIEPHFRTRMLAAAGFKAALTVALYYAVRWDAVPFTWTFAFGFFSVMYFVFGFVGFKAELPSKRDELVEDRRFEERVLAEPDDPPMELPSRSAAPRRFK